jgi:hypothetical protein
MLLRVDGGVAAELPISELTCGLFNSSDYVGLKPRSALVQEQADCYFFEALHGSC